MSNNVHHRSSVTHSHNHDVNKLVKKYLAVKNERCKKAAVASTTTTTSPTLPPWRSHLFASGELLGEKRRRSNDADADSSKKYSRTEFQLRAQPASTEEFVVHREASAINYPTTEARNIKNKSGSIVGDVISLIDSDDEKCSVFEAGDRCRRGIANNHDAIEINNSSIEYYRIPEKKMDVSHRCGVKCSVSEEVEREIRQKNTNYQDSIGGNKANIQENNVYECLVDVDAKCAVSDVVESRIQPFANHHEATEINNLCIEHRTQHRCGVECAVSNEAESGIQSMANPHDATKINNPRIERRAPEKDLYGFHRCGTERSMSEELESGILQYIANHHDEIEEYENRVNHRDFLPEEDSLRSRKDPKNVVNEPCKSACTPTGMLPQDVTTTPPARVAPPPPSRVQYPIGCPVWFNIHYSIPCSKYLMADKGVVRSISFNQAENKVIYWVEKQPTTKLNSSPNIVSITEENIAFAIHCPILVRMEDCSNTEMEGEIIHLKLTMIGQGVVSRMILYTVLLNADEGEFCGVRVEDNVPADRICYRLSLHVIQSRLREAVLSSSSLDHPICKAAFGIRSDEWGHALRNKSPPKQLHRQPPPKRKEIVTKKNCSLLLNQYNSQTDNTSICADHNYNDEDEDEEDSGIGSSSEDDSSSRWDDDEDEASE